MQTPKRRRSRSRAHPSLHSARLAAVVPRHRHPLKHRLEALVRLDHLVDQTQEARPVPPRPLHVPEMTVEERRSLPRVNRRPTTAWCSTQRDTAEICRRMLRESPCGFFFSSTKQHATHRESIICLFQHWAWPVWDMCVPPVPACAQQRPKGNDKTRQGMSDSADHHQSSKEHAGQTRVTQARSMRPGRQARNLNDLARARGHAPARISGPRCRASSARPASRRPTSVWTARNPVLRVRGYTDRDQHAGLVRRLFVGQSRSRAVWGQKTRARAWVIAHSPGSANPSSSIPAEGEESKPQEAAAASTQPHARPRPARLWELPPSVSLLPSFPWPRSTDTRKGRDQQRLEKRCRIPRRRRRTDFLEGLGPHGERGEIRHEDKLKGELRDGVPAGSFVQRVVGIR